MKKCAIALTVIFVLAGCSAPVAEQSVTTTEITEAVTTAETAASAKTTPEITTAVNIKSKFDDDFRLTEFETRQQWQAEEKPNREYVEITADTEFYECEYISENVYDGGSFPDLELAEKAREAFLASDTYVGIYSKALEEYKLGGGANPDTFTTDAVLKQAVSYDFNNDGRTESAFIFEVAPDFTQTEEIAVMAVWRATGMNAPCYLVLMDCDGNCTVPSKNYAMNAELCQLRYKDFAHLVIFGGVSNSSSCADYFSVNENGFEHELREFQRYGLFNGVFLCNTMSFEVNRWLIFWNEEHNCYVTPEVEYLSLEESAELMMQFPKSSQSPLMVIGGAIYSEYNGYVYQRTDDGFTPINMGSDGESGEEWYGGLGERARALNREFPIPFAKNFDFEKAMENIVTLE